MKTKIGLPFGLALVMFIGIFTTMLALGVLSPSRAQAVTGDFEVMLSNHIPDHHGDWSFEVVSSAAFMGADATATPVVESDSLVITFPADVDLTDSSVTEEANWKLGGKPVADASVLGAVVTLMPQAAAAAIAGPPAVAAIPAFNIAAGDPIKVEFTAPTPGHSSSTPAGSGIMNPSDASTVDETLDVSITGSTDSGTATSKGFRFDTTRVGQLEVTASPDDPGAAAQYQIKFFTGVDLQEGTGIIILEIDSSVGVPTSLSERAVRISASALTNAASSENQSRPLDLAPTYRVLTGTDNRKEYRIAVPDMDADVAENSGIAEHALVTLTLLSNAGFTNPTESGKDDFTVSTSASPTEVERKFTTPVQLFSDDKADNRNKPLTVTGKGFKNGTSATVYLDRNRNGMKDAGDVDLITVPVASDDTFEATFNVTVPPFEALPNKNVINAVDGEAPVNTLKWTVPTDADHDTLIGLAMAAKAPIFEVEGLLTVSPATLGIGDTLTIDLKDWPNETVTKLVIGGVDHSVSGRSVNNNTLQFDIVVKNEVGLGTQQVEITSENESDNTNVLISGATVIVNPTTVVPNQSISVTGRSFSDSATINLGDDTSSVSLGGSSALLKTVNQGSSNKINGGDVVRVDNGGNWSASIVVPVTQATINSGPHALKIIDSKGREGVAILTLAERTLTLEPAASRVGTTVTIRGTGFPARNSSEGASGVQVVQIEYNESGDFRTVSSVTPDSSGSFVTTFRVPLNAGIPSTNGVRASFRYDESGVDTGEILTLTTHRVPEGTIELDKTEAKAGDMITVTGEGFKAYTSITMIEVGDIEVTPAPRPSTGNTGGFTAEFLLPQLDLGIKNIEVEIGKTTASASLTVVEETAPVMPEVMMAEAATPDVAFAAVIAEDNLIAVYHFDPATQNEAPNYGYTVYDARPLFMSGNNLDSIEPGQFYTVEVSEDQMGVTLGSQTVDLYAAFTPIRW